MATSPAPNNLFDVFATVEDGRAKVLAATRRNSDQYSITITGLGSLGKEGTVQKRALGFAWDGILGRIDDPVDFGVEEHRIVDDTVCLRKLPPADSRC